PPPVRGPPLPPRWLRRVVVCSWLGVACLLPGCGPGEVRGAKLRGQVVMNGQPLKPQSGERVWVTFEHVDSGAGGKPVIMSAGRVQQDGTFTIEGQTKRGSPPGKYNVTIHAESSGDRESRLAALLPPGKSTLVADVTDREDQSFVIDLGKKTVTRQ